jgi:coenzyme F420 hydrogenase subunit beta
MSGVLHIGQDPEEPIRNRTRLSRTRGELLAATGSRYSPASVCNGLGLLDAASAPGLVIGTPSEIAAVRKVCKLRPILGQKVGATLSFFCAGSPSTRGTLALLEHVGVNPLRLRDLRYRGQGWPGHFAPILAGESEPCRKLPYRESWAFLQAYRPWAVQLWPDGVGELADISCGDPWYAEPDGENPGFSLVLARTPQGREIIEGAMKAGYLSLKPADGWKVVQSQKGLLQKKGSVWGRRWAMHCFGLPVTKVEGLELWKGWRQLAFKDQLRSTLGTIRRILKRRLYRPLKLNPLEGARVKPAMIGIKDA